MVHHEPEERLTIRARRCDDGLRGFVAVVQTRFGVGVVTALNNEGVVDEKRS